MTEQHQKIGLANATATVIASMIGVGIFMSPGYTLASLGSPSLAALAWLTGGVIAICGAISYGALASKLTESGGEYLYLSRRVHPWAGFVAGWTSLFAGFAGPCAAAALAFEEFFPVDLPGGRSVPIAMIVVFTLLHGRTTTGGAATQTLLVAVKSLFVVSVVAIIWSAREPTLAAEANQIETTVSFAPGEFAVSLMWIALTYTGFNAAIYIAGDVRNAERTVPRALVLGTVVTTLLYLALVISLYSLIGSSAVNGDAPNGIDPVAQPFQSALAMIYPTNGLIRNGFAAVICLCLVTSVSAMIQTGPRVIEKMARDGLFPQILVTRDGQPPLVATLIQSAIAMVLVLATPLRELLTHLGMTLSLCSAASIATLLRPGTGISLPMGLVAALYIVATCVSAFFAIHINPFNGAGAAATVVTATIAYWCFRGSPNRPNRPKSSEMDAH